MFQRAPRLELSFNEFEIEFSKVEDEWIDETKIENVVPCDLLYFDECEPGNSIASVHPKGNRFNSIKLHQNKVCNTIAAGSKLYHYEQKRKLTKAELIKIGTFPNDYNFLKNKPIYLIGMSVPPVMVAQITDQIYDQWLSKI